MDLSIVILGYKMRDLIKNCIKSIKEQNLNINYEIIVVDNNSNDGTDQMMAKLYPDIKFIKLNKNFGYPKGNNYGIKIAQGRYIITLNPDTIIFDNSFEKLVRYMDENKDIGIIAPKLLNPNKTLQYTCFRFYKLLTPFVRRTFLYKTKWGKKHHYNFEMRDWDHNDIKDVDWVQGSALMIRKSVIDIIGIKDERFFLYFSDVAWCEKCWQAGFKVIYYPKASIIHFYHRESSGGIFAILFKKTGRAHIKDWLMYLKNYTCKRSKKK